MALRHEESALLYLSTEHAVANDPDLGRWKFNINNTIYMDKAIKIVPTTVSVPNIFPNVNIYNNKFSVTDDLDVTTNYEIKVGQYTLDELVAELNTFDVDIIFSTVDSKVNLLIDFPATFRTEGPDTDFFDLIGWTRIANAVNGGHEVLAPSTVTGPDVVNLGGEKMVFLVCDHVAPGNLIYGADGMPYDVFSAVSFHDVEYGQTSTFRAADVHVDDISFKGHSDLCTLVMELKDSKMRVLPMPSNYHIRVVFKVFHREHSPGKMHV